MELHDFLASHRDALLSEATEALSRRHLPHYQAVGLPEAQRRLTALYDKLLDGARRRHLDGIVEHAERIGRERFEEGAQFVEVQSAFNLLEEVVWRALLASFPPAELGQALGMISTLLGAAKDRLAATYVSKATQVHTPTLDLRSLFSGTQNTGGGAR